MHGGFRIPWFDSKVYEIYGNCMHCNVLGYWHFGVFRAKHWLALMLFQCSGRPFILVSRSWIGFLVIMFASLMSVKGFCCVYLKEMVKWTNKGSKAHSFFVLFMGIGNVLLGLSNRMGLGLCGLNTQSLAKFISEERRDSGS